MRGPETVDVTPDEETMRRLLGAVPSTDGWRLGHRGGNFYEIRAPHPNGRDNWWMGVADITAPLAVAQMLFAAAVAASRTGDGTAPHQS